MSTPAIGSRSERAWGLAAPRARAADLLSEARGHEQTGCMDEAIGAYERAIACADPDADRTVLAEAARRLAVVFHQRNEPDRARVLCERSHDVATRAGHAVLAAEALNVLAGFALERGEIGMARDTYRRALALGGASLELRARIEQNLGILANLRGELEQALAHYQRSLDAWRSLGDERECAIAYHNLGMMFADRGAWDEADAHYTRSLAIAEAVGDLHLQGLCRLNHAEVHLARQRFAEALRGAEAALGVFDQLGTRLDKADAYRVIGVVYRETGRLALAESRLRAAVELAVATGSVLTEAETARELGRLYQAMGRNQEALSQLTAAHRLFQRLDARVDLVDVAAKRTDLEETYFAVVREWGQSIESSDSYTHGHCERVAGYALRVARALGFDEVGLTTVRLGAYLHDLGKVRVPHEILNKPGALTPRELEIMQMHPVWGLDLLATVEFPWDLKPIIRWHHEKYDGSGYPDRLRGNEIPVAAQVIGIVDVYDALTTTRSYRAALDHAEALSRLRASRGWWSPAVYDAFMDTVGAGA